MIFKTVNGSKKAIKKAYSYSVDYNAKSLSKLQKAAKDILYDYWLADLVYEEFPVAGSRLRFDFYNATKNIVVEVDGNQHYKYNKHFHSKNKNKFLDQLKKDDHKEKFCRLNNIELIRIREDLNMEEQFEEIKHKL